MCTSAARTSVNIFVTLVMALPVTLVCGINVDCIREMKCPKKLPTPAQLDMEWATKVGDWYINAGSLLDLTFVAADLLNVPIADVALEDLYYNACFHFSWNNRTILTGFGGKESDVELKPDPGVGMEGWMTFRQSNLGLEGNKAAITLTDNSTFAFLYLCRPGAGEAASWAVISTTPRLPEGKMKQIWSHAKSLGFSEKLFTRIRYETCEHVT